MPILSYACLIYEKGLLPEIAAVFAMDIWVGVRDDVPGLDGRDLPECYRVVDFGDPKGVITLSVLVLCCTVHLPFISHMHPREPCEDSDGIVQAFKLQTSSGAVHDYLSVSLGWNSDV